MSAIEESYKELSKLKQIGLPIVLVLMIVLGETFFLIRFLHMDILFKLLGIQISVITILHASRIKKNKHIYLVTSFTYEEAKGMLPETRSKIALKIYKMIAVPMTAMFIYLMMGFAFRTSGILDLAVIICMLFVLCVFGDTWISESAYIRQNEGIDYSNWDVAKRRRIYYEWYRFLYECRTIRIREFWNKWIEMLVKSYIMFPWFSIMLDKVSSGFMKYHNYDMINI